jgi:hypothetical protein
VDYSWQKKANESLEIAAVKQAKNEAFTQKVKAVHDDFIKEVIRPFLTAMNHAGNPGLIKCLDQTQDMAGWRCTHRFFSGHSPGWKHPDIMMANFVRVYLDGRFWVTGGEHWHWTHEKFELYSEWHLERAVDDAQRKLIDILLAHNVPMPE